MNRKSDYALRILRSLQDGKVRIAPVLAADEQIPLAFVYKILKQLSKAGIVGLERGPKGGCCLLVDLKEVSLYDLIITTILEISRSLIPACPISPVSARRRCLI